MKDKIYEVTEQQYKKIRSVLDGRVFFRRHEGKFYVKTEFGNLKRIIESIL